MIYLEYDADCASFSWVNRSSRDWLEKREEDRNMVTKKLDHFYERFFVSNSQGYARQVSIMNSQRGRMIVKTKILERYNRLLKS